MVQCQFHPAQLPKLTSTKRADTIKFKIQYQTLCRANKQNGTAAEGYKTHIDFDLLSSLVELRVFKGCTDANDLNEAQIKTWLGSRMKLTSTNAFACVKEAVRYVVFVPDEKDPDGGALQFFADILSALRKMIDEHSWEAIQFLTQKLEPATLRKKFEYQYRYCRRTKIVTDSMLFRITYSLWFVNR